MSAIDVTIKTLKEIFRQPRNLALMLGFPVAFMLIFGLAFGGSTETTYKVAVLNEDAGALGARYVDGFSNMTYSSGKHLLDVRILASASEGRDLLRTRDASLFVHVPANFTAGLTPPSTSPNNPGPVPPVGSTPPQGRAPPPGAVVETLSDPGSGDSIAASQIVAAYTEAFSEKASGQTPAVRASGSFITASGFSPFDFIAPGIMVYAMLAMAPQAAAALARETELKTIDRIRLSPIGAASLLFGVALAQLVLAVVSLSLMLLTARLMGFHNQGTYLGAFGIAMVAAMSVMGLGMLIASFARTQQEAAGMGVLISVPMSFLSGAFFTIPGVYLFTWGSRRIGLYDVLPTKHAVDAIRQALTFGQGFDAIAWSLGAMLILAVIYFAAGVYFFRRARLAPE